MKPDLFSHRNLQVFLNYPFDTNFQTSADAMHFAVVAANLLPICARDLTAPDSPRLEMLVHAISSCHYSAHEFSRSKGEGPENFARMNMPIEMGMALFHALQTQWHDHRCSFFVPTPYDYKEYASDLAGLDLLCHDNDEAMLVSLVYEWLRDVVPVSVFNSRATVDVVAKFREYEAALERVNGASVDGTPSHNERRELMFPICGEAEWWDWRKTKPGQAEFPVLPLSWKGA